MTGPAGVGAAGDDLATLIPHRDWCHVATHGDCCGTPDDQWSCDCGTAEIRARVSAYAERHARQAAERELRAARALWIEPDDQLGAGYYEAFARLDQQSLGRLLHWLQTGEALPVNDPRIPVPFGDLR